MACNETTNVPVTMNPFMNALLQQLLTYITMHAEEIIALLLGLITGEVPNAVKNAVHSFRVNPNQDTLNNLVQRMTENGHADFTKATMTIVNNAKV